MRRQFLVPLLLTIFVAITLILLPKEIEEPQYLDTKATLPVSPGVSFLGVGVHSHTPDDRLEWYDYQKLRAGWFFTWHYGNVSNFIVPSGMTFYPMVYSGNCNSTFQTFVSGRPDLFPDGTTFFIGNEIYDGAASTTSGYATAYHNCRQMIKGINSSYKTALAAMRSSDNTYFFEEAEFRYYYKKYFGTTPPIDAYRLHIYTGSIDNLKSQIKKVRGKMKQWGDQDKDLIITESCARGSPSYDNAGFLPQALNYVNTATDADIGKPGDGHKLVQKFAWFSLNSDRIYPNCSLFNPSQHRQDPPPPIRSTLTEVGTAFVTWANLHAPAIPPTNTPTNTPRPTNTPTNTPRPTNTPQPTNTPTSTPRPTATNTLQPTNTAVPIPPTNTPRPHYPTNTPPPTNTPIPLPPTNTPRPTATNTPQPTNTSVPLLPTNTSRPHYPTNTPQPTNTPVPLPAANTPIPPTATSTNTPQPTNTPVPLPPTNTSAPGQPTSTPQPTNTPIPLPPPATSTPRPTNAPVPLPPTSTSAPGQSTSTPQPTNTSVPLPPTNTPIPSHATDTPDHITSDISPTVTKSTKPSAPLSTQKLTIIGVIGALITILGIFILL